MTARFYDAYGNSIVLQRPLQSGGEATLWLGPNPNVVAKIYHTPTVDQAKKLSYMLDTPPWDALDASSHAHVAWPTQLVMNGQGEVVGFMMPRLAKGKTLAHVYTPKLRLKNAPGFNWMYMHTACRNIAWIVHQLHRKNYVIGDIKPDNFLVTDQALVSVVDVDSFQVYVAEGRIFFCPVGSEGFTPPELIDADLHTVQRRPYHDAFGLAVILYMMLLGHHPYAGAWTSTTSPPPTLDGLIKMGQWIGQDHSALHVGPHTLGLDILHPAVADLMHQAFSEGHTLPHRRPTALQWVNALDMALEDLVLCSQHHGHYHSAQNQGCPWCTVHKATGLDLYPAPKDMTADPYGMLRHFTKAAQEGNDVEILRLWSDPVVRRALEQAPEQFPHIVRAQRHNTILEKIQLHVRLKPHDDEGLLGLWGEEASFEASTLAFLPQANLGNQSPHASVKAAQDRQAFVVQLLTLCERGSHGTYDFLRVQDLWKQWDQKSHPTIQRYADIFLPVLESARRYQLLCKHLHSASWDKALALWDEPLFARQLEADGLMGLLHQALASYMPKPVVFRALLPNEGRSLHRYHQWLNIHWAVQGRGGASGTTQDAPWSAAFVAVRGDRPPTSPEDVISEAHQRRVTYAMNQPQGLWVPLGVPLGMPLAGDGPGNFWGEGDSPSVYVGIWPAEVYGGVFVVAGAPLQLVSHPRPYIECEIKPRRHKVRVKLMVPKGAPHVTVPPLTVMVGHPYRPSLSASLDLQATHAGPLGRMEACVLAPGEHYTQSFSVPPWCVSTDHIGLLPIAPYQSPEFDIYYTHKKGWL